MVKATDKKMIGQLVNVLKEKAGEKYEVGIQEIVKNNGRYIGVTAKKEGTNACPVLNAALYLNDCGDLNSAAEEMMKDFDKAFKTVPAGVGSDFINKENILSKVKYKVIGRDGNEELLEGVPHKDIVDMSCIYVCDVKSVGGIMTVNYKMMDVLGISFVELEEAAMRNLLDEKFKVCPLLAMIAGISNVELDVNGPEDKPYVLTSDDGFLGARVILREDLLKKVADRFNDDLYILPSSIHELLAVPVEDCDPDELRGMVTAINAEQVAECDRLTNNVYRFVRDTGEIKAA